MGHSWTVAIQKKLDSNQSVFSLKKRPFYNNKEQNKSNQSSGVIGPTNSLAQQLQANAFSFLIENSWAFLFLKKIIDFSMNNGFINFSSIFFLNLFNFQLSVSKERLLFLSNDLTFILGCSFKPEVIVFWL